MWGWIRTNYLSLKCSVLTAPNSLFDLWQGWTWSLDEEGSPPWFPSCDAWGCWQSRGEIPEQLLQTSVSHEFWDWPTEGLGREKASRTDLYYQGDKKVIKNPRVLSKGMSSSGVRDRIWLYLAYSMRKSPLANGEQVTSVKCITKTVAKITLKHV